MNALATAVNTLVEQYPALIQSAGTRWEKAQEIVLTQLIDPAPFGNGGTYFVQSQSRDVKYRVNTIEKSCSCPDAGRGNICKHRIAVHLYRQARQAEIDRKIAISTTRQAMNAAWNTVNTQATRLENLPADAYGSPAYTEIHTILAASLHDADEITDHFNVLINYA